MKEQFNPFHFIVTNSMPDAFAEIKGNTQNPLLRGTAAFYRTPMGGILIEVEVFHLPDNGSADESDFFGMHIHEFGDCSDDFDKVGDHYNPLNLPHPEHAGDLPPLLSNNGYAWSVVYDSRLSISEIVGRSIIIHGGRDDFTTQPSGHSGSKIGCGVIEAF